MAINPTVATYGTNRADNFSAVVDVDVNRAFPNDPKIDTAKAAVMVIGGSLDPEGAFTPGGINANITPSPLPAATDRSAVVNMAATVLMPANADRMGGYIQNTDAAIEIGISEFGVAVIGDPGTFNLQPGATYQVRTNREISAVAFADGASVTAIEW